jgi:putative colanic acid biosynthesis UDP-glucose lipid carrier transferase
VLKRKNFAVKCTGIVVDVLIMNIVFLFVYCWTGNQEDIVLSLKHNEILLLLNACYFISYYFSPIKLSERVIGMEKIIKRVSTFILIHLLLFVSGLLFLSFYVEDIEFIFIFYAFYFIFFAAWRITIRHTLKTCRKSGRNILSVVIVGMGKNGTELYEEMLTQNYYGCRVLGIFDDDESVKRNFHEYKGRIADVEAFCLKYDVKEIYCTLPSSEDEIITNLLSFSEKNMIRFYIVPEFYRYIKRKLTLKNIDRIPVVAVRDEPLQYWYNKLAKRVFDIVFSLLILLIVYPPLYIVLGVLIKLSSPGSIVFKQQRTGLGGREFFCYKFRSMELCKDANEKQAIKNDPRVTGVGKFMRKTNLDEFPQFYNVLKGDMSVVGPRPHMLKHTEEYSKLIDKYMVRHLVRPGVTGWAQITGFRGETQDLKQMEERVKRDVWYIENYSFLLDLKIIFNTGIKIFVVDKNAY